MNIRDYLIDHTTLSWGQLLEEWSWLLPADYKVQMLTKAGDLVITLPDGSVHVLDVGAGQLIRVASNCDELFRKLEDDEFSENFLMVSVVDQLTASGIILGADQCFSFSQLPTLGGSYEAGNRMAFPINEHFGALGLIQGQIADLPDGSEVLIEPVDDTTGDPS